MNVRDGAAISAQLNALQVRDLGTVAETLPGSGTVSSALSGEALVKSEPGTLAFDAAAPNLKYVLLNAGTFELSSPELLSHPLDVFVADGAMLSERWSGFAMAE